MRHACGSNVCKALVVADMLSEGHHSGMRDALVKCLAENLEKALEADSPGFASLPIATVADVLTHPTLVSTSMAS